MIRLHLRSYPNTSQSALDKLTSFQRAIDSHTSYIERVEAARREWKKKRRSRTMKIICDMLGMMCSGERRCMFCEDSAASGVDHFHPKGRYPELAFAWLNFLFSCSVCNETKGTKFKVRRANGRIIKLRPHACSAPPAGDPLLINPRFEDPLAFIRLDLDTGILMPACPEGSLDFKRANFTLTALELNKRDVLRRERRAMVSNYRYLLDRYTSRKRAGALEDELHSIVTMLQSRAHRTVWEEMKRQHLRIPALRALFAQAPEALHW